MTSIVKTKDRVCQHLRSLDVSPRESARFASLISKWLSNNGPEWTAERLKSIKQCHQEAIQSDDNSYTIPPGWASRENRNGKRILKDGFVHRVISHSGFNLKQVEGILRIYQVLELDKPSKKQLIKMCSAIEAEPSINLQSILDISSKLKPRSCGNNAASLSRVIQEKSKSLPEFLGMTSKRSPVVKIDHRDRITYSKTLPRTNPESADWFEYFQASKPWNDLWKKYPKEISRVFRTSEAVFSSATMRDEDPLLGNVTILQSPGCKARWIANPLLPIQAIGESLKDKLLAYTRVYPEIKTLNQDAGHQVVVDWLKSGSNVYSFDATAFTDRFPVSLQIELARKLVAQGVISQFDFDALSIVVRGKWYSTDLKREIKWKIGQPLGYGPSFHLATLTHAAVLDHIDFSINGMKTSCWQVVGDDVVINNKQVAERYKELMTDFGVEINLQKSLISSKYAEFLGKLITSEGVNPSMKVRLLTNRSQIQDALAFYGMNGFKFLSKNEKRQALEVFLPEHYGGLGWKINNVPYEKYMMMFNHHKLSSRVIRKELRDFFGQPRDSNSEATLVKLRSDYYKRNSVPIALSEYERIFDREVLTLDDFRDIPVLSSDQQISADAGGPPSFISTVDTIVKLENLTSKPILTKSGKLDRSNLATSVLNRHGYVSNSEKPLSGQSDSIPQIKENINESKESNQFPPKGIFRRDFFLELGEISKKLKIRHSVEERHPGATNLSSESRSKPKRKP